MAIYWRAEGDSVGVIDLRELEGESVVIHFGGEPRSVDAYTFANSLVAFADVATAVNNVMNPGQNVELRLEANGPGSFRAQVKRRAKGPVAGFFSRGAENLLWTAVGLVLLQPLFSAPETKISVSNDEVTIERGGDKIIVPRTVYDQSGTIEADPEVRRNVRRTFDVLEQDEAIENFGLTKRINDKSPVVQISRPDFGRVSEGPELIADDETPKRRKWKEKARLIVQKAWFTRGTKKWTFQWNNVPISAPIKDAAFWDKVERHEVVFGSGDALDVELEFDQNREDALGVWENDPATYVVTKVIRTIPRKGKQEVLDV